jgi:hypothetical protein
LTLLYFPVIIYPTQYSKNYRIPWLKKSKTKGGKYMEAYCVKCRAKREMKEPKSITMKNGKPATKGVCPTCGTKMFRIGKS